MSDTLDSPEAPQAAARTARLPPVATVVLLVLAALGASWLLSPVLPVASLALVFLVAVLLAAAAHGVWAGVSAALLAALAYNFFFIPPILTFQVAGVPELFALGVFIVAAVITGSVAGRMRQRADEAGRYALTVRLLNDFAGKLSAATDRDAVLAMAGSQLAITLHTPVVLLETGPDGALRQRGAWPGGQMLSAGDSQAAARCARTGTLAARPADPDPDQRYEFRPLPGQGLVIGIRRQPPATTQDDNATEAVLRHTGIALSRLDHARQAAEAQQSAEQERIRNAMLSSLSHDLRTPLATILGSVTTLRELGPSMPEEAKADLLAAIEDEAGRLSRFVSDLLHMTRVEAGALAVRRDWVDLADVCRAAAARTRRAHPGLGLTIDLAADLPLAFADAGLLEQVLVNLLDNAAKYGAPPVVLAAATAQGGVALSVTDQGPGVPPADQAVVFDKFTRAPRRDGDPPGAGLGLAIAQGMTVAMGGRLTLESPVLQGKGARFTVLLPTTETPG